MSNEDLKYPHLWLRGAGDGTRPTWSIAVFGMSGGDLRWRMIRYPTDFSLVDRNKILAEGHRLFSEQYAERKSHYPYGTLIGYWVVFSENDRMLFNTAGELAEDQSPLPHRGYCTFSIK